MSHRDKVSRKHVKMNEAEILKCTVGPLLYLDLGHFWGFTAFLSKVRKKGKSVQKV